ncbi:MAG: glycosyltransferase family 4 protein [Anaerolineae bacterium]|jgi:glycosyltransferase involved in cell wall biosynthesis
MARSRVLILSHDVVDARMAGPGIRYWELARVLARSCAVTLAVPWQSSLQAADFTLAPYQPGDWPAVRALAAEADVIMPCGNSLHQFPGLAEMERALVVDGYDPYPAETLSTMLNRSPEEQATYHRHLADRIRLECLAGDFFLCASERQRYWWLGLLAAHGRLNTRTYGADPTLRNLVDVVPFGCRSEPLQHTRPVLKGVVPGIGAGDRVLLWGGGIWEWLDPLTLLRAVHQIVGQHPDLRLVFPGTRHPNQAVDQMPMTQRAIELARDLDLLDRHVFFGDWVPYVDWPNYLLEADLGVSLHFDSLETDLAFRSRILDYIRAGLPMVVTRGDATGEMVTAYDLGIVVDYEDIDGVSRALLGLLAQPYAARQSQFAEARADLAWERVARPLVTFCHTPHRAADHVTPAPGSAATEIARLEGKVQRQKSENEALRALVRGYEQGRFIRFMQKLQAWRAKFGLGHK